jgi:serine/threonine protein kinase
MQVQHPLTSSSIHQDIKPANILVAIRDRDPSFNYTFKLVDMGLAYFSTSNTQERNYRKKDGRGTQTYSKLSGS